MTVERPAYGLGVCLGHPVQLVLSCRNLCEGVTLPTWLAASGMRLGGS